MAVLTNNLIKAKVNGLPILACQGAISVRGTDLVAFSQNADYQQFQAC
jgi:hypothetical protein